MLQARIRLTGWLIALLMVPAAPALSSEFGLTFNRDNRTYRWNTFLRYSASAGPRVRVHTSGHLSKILIKRASSSSGADRRQDNFNVTAGFDYRLTKWSSMGVNLAGEQNTVNRGEITTRTGTFSSILTLNPRSSIQLKSFVGGKTDQKQQQNLDSKEEGLNYGFSGSWQPVLAKTQTRLQLDLSSDRLVAGHSSTRKLLASVKRPLFRGVKVSLSFEDQEQGRTNLFGPVDATVLKRQDRINRALNFKLELPLPRDIQTHVSLSSTDRRIEYSLPRGANDLVREQNSRKVMNSFSCQVLGQPIGLLTIYGDFALREGKNDFGRDINDEDIQEISLSAGMGTTLSPSDSLGLSGHVARTSYDAPHPDNYNDRDSFLGAGKLTYIHTFSEALQFVGEATAHFTHLVYLRSQRSANNNWARLYALYPTLYIRPGDNLQIKQRFSISANYTEYDFDDLFTNIKSNIFRQAKTITDLSYRLGEEFSLNISYTYRAEDFGRLVRDDGWVEILSWDKSFQNTDLSVSYTLIPRLIITPNLGYSRRREYRHQQGARVFRRQLLCKRIGLSGRYRLWPDNDIVFSLNRSVEDASGSPERIYDRLQLNLQHSF